MKKFYTLLLFVLAIPMSTMAQITHRFPELTIKTVSSSGTESTNTYYLPAWDALTEDGFIRVQATTVPEEDPNQDGGGWGPGGGGAPGDGIIITGVGNQAKILRAPRHAEGIIVAGHLAICTNMSNTPITGIWASTINVYYNSTLKKTAANLEAWNLTYGDIFTTEEMPDETMRAERLFIEVNDYNITGNYSIPETANDSKFAEEGNVTTINIVGLGDCAYYNRYPRKLDQYGADANGVRHEPFNRATSITIPAHIKSLGKRCFYGAPFMTNVTIADNSQIKTIPTYCFARNISLREINIPASVTSFGDFAFGNCALGKIQFDSNRSTPPTITKAFNDASSSTPKTNKALCAIWVNSIETVKAFRNKSSEWDAFPFCVPFDLKKEIVTYCSDLLLSPKSLQLGAGMTMNDPTSGSTTNNNPNKWVLDTDADSLKLYYVATDKPQNPQTTSRTISISQMTLSAAPSGYGVLISGKPEKHPLYIREVTATTTQVQTFMVGTLEPTPWFEEDGYSHYLLKDGKFYLWGWDDLAANKAYLRLPTDYFDGRTSAKELNIVFEGNGDTDGMQGVVVTESNTDDAWYTLQGVRIETPNRGIFIRGGKKYVIK